MTSSINEQIKVESRTVYTISYWHKKHFFFSFLNQAPLNTSHPDVVPQQKRYKQEPKIIIRN